MVDPLELRAYYNCQGLSGNLARGFFDQQFEHMYLRRRREFIARLFKIPITESTALDIGAGVGVNSLAMAQSGYKTISIDLSASYLLDTERVLRSSNLSPNVVVADASHLPIREESIDFVLCSEVLEHLPDPELCVSEIGRVVKAAGRFVVSVPSGLSLTERFKHLIGDKEHLHVFHPEETRKMLEVENLHVTWISSCNTLFVWVGFVLKRVHFPRLLYSPIFAFLSGVDDLVGRSRFAGFAWCFVVFGIRQS